jgi:YbbR domain-containing protein
VLSIAPDSLIFPFENMSVKTVPVKLNTEITFASGYDILDNINIEPDSVKVIGPKNIVDNISRINTKVLKLNNVNSTIDEKVNLVLDKSLQKVKISNDKVRLFGSVEKFTEGTFEVPITIINLPADVKINYFPKTISVSYYVSLQNYKSIKTSDFKIICDYSEVQNQDRTYFKPQLVTKSALVKSAKMKQNKVEFIITQ